MMRCSSKRTVSIIIALALALGCCLPALALDEVEMRTVRVGFYHTEGYHVMDEDGKRSGYAYDILQTMKIYANWRYEYIGYDKGWADIQQMLLDGEIDMVISALKTPARMEIYDFSQRSIGQSGASLMVNAGKSSYVAGDYESYNGMRIGFIENAGQIASTEAFAEEKGFTYEPVYYKTSAELEAAITSGEDVDAIVTSNMRIIAGTRRLEMFAMQDIFAMVKKGNTELMAEIDYALEQISLYNPGLYESLYNKYYSLDEGDTVFFSPEERELIERIRRDGVKLRAALVPDTSPYSFYDGDEPSGILYDVAMEILRRTGLEIELVVKKTDAEYRDLLEGGELDLLLTARSDLNYAETLGYTLIAPYYTTDVSRVTLKNFEGGIKSVAAVKKSIIDMHYLPTVITDETVVYYGSTAECVDAVLRGDCDALYLFTRTAQEAVFKDETNRLNSVIMPKFSVGFTFAVREGVDTRLCSIFEKAAYSLSDADVNNAVLKYTDYGVTQLTLLGLFYNNPMIMMGIVALILVLLFAAVMLVFVSRKRAAEKEQNRLLAAALQSAESANSAKSVFMSRMSHEIRTPLNAIVGYSSIANSALSGARSEPEYRQAAMRAMDCLSKSDVASKHLLTVINDVLDMSAIESGKIKIAQEPFDFKSTITALTTMFFSQAKAKGISFDVIFDEPTEEWFIGDQMRLNQIFTNLLSNAIKFTPSGGAIRLAICQPESDARTALVRFEVSDTGIGMSQDFLENIWSPFEQADASISRRFGGTGLGLSITKNLVDLMGGSITAQSVLNMGSTFVVELRLGRTRQPEPQGLLDFSGVNALVVDDDLSTCDYIQLLFSRAGAKCKTVNSGDAAITAVAEGLESGAHFTVCIIDWFMPGKDGLETVRGIRHIAGPDIPIIIISAYDFSEIEDEAREAGVDSFISKPLFQSTVFDLLAGVSGKLGAKMEPKREKPDFGGARVLLAEDNRMNMEIAKAMLTAWGMTVDEAHNGAEAVDMFCSSPAGSYKVILMDVHMPEMDGYRATQAIRDSGHAEAATIPIVAMTADVFAEDVAEAMAAGMNSHIGKPIDRVLLLDTMRRYCSL